MRARSLIVALFGGSIACAGNYRTATTNDAGIDATTNGDDGGADDGATCIKHSNGIGQSFCDGVAVGTYNLTQANEACVAFSGFIVQCRQSPCTGGGEVVCSSGSPTSCACWGYSGPIVGHVFNSGAPGAGNCICPSPADATWN